MKKKIERECLNCKFIEEDSFEGNHCGKCQIWNKWEPRPESKTIEVTIKNIAGVRYEITYEIPLGLINIGETRKGKLILEGK